MKNRQHYVVIEKVVDKALVIAVKMAVESIPVVGPIFVAATLFADMKAISRHRARVRAAQ